MLDRHGTAPIGGGGGGGGPRRRCPPPHPPGKGTRPGGRVDWGETLQDALRREVIEETGLEVEPGELAGLVERIHLDEGFHYVILDYHVTITGGTLRPGSDVTDARWVLPSQLASLELSDGLLEALRDWGVQTSHRPKLSR